MSAQTPMHSIVRVGRQIFTVDMARNRHLVGEGNTLEDADWIAACLSQFHKKPYEIEPAPSVPYKSNVTEKRPESYEMYQDE